MSRRIRRRKSPEAASAETVLRKRGRPAKDGPREANGRLKREPSPEKVMRVALLARAAKSGTVLPVDDAGKPVITKAIAADLRQQFMGCVAGLAIRDHHRRAELWETVQAVRSRRAAWLRCIDAPADCAKGSALPVEPNPPDEGVVVDRPYDDRTDEEKADQAEATWNRMASLMATVNPLLQRVICLDEPVSGPVCDWIVSLDRLVRE